MRKEARKGAIPFLVLVLSCAAMLAGCANLPGDHVLSVRCSCDAYFGFIDARILDGSWRVCLSYKVHWSTR